jgi:hypothetical protein
MVEKIKAGINQWQQWIASIVIIGTIVYTSGASDGKVAEQLKGKADCKDLVEVQVKTNETDIRITRLEASLDSRFKKLEDKIEALYYEAKRNNR